MGLVLQIRSYRCSHGTANLIAQYRNPIRQNG
ncbi:Uncharacterised protein [Vibrio cholerae]|nr:Uncharacterised protein [Vibrio cholerae]